MAFAFTTTVLPLKPDPLNRRAFLVTVAETDSSNLAASEWSTAAGEIPVKGRIMDYKATLNSGSGSTLDPVVGPQTDPALKANLDTIVINNGTTAQPISLTQAGGFRYYSSTGRLFGRSVPDNATEDHVIGTQFLILEGWD